MLNKEDYFLVLRGLMALKSNLENQYNDLYAKGSTTTEDKESLEKLNHQILTIDNIRSRFEMDRNTKNWLKLFKKAFKRSLLKKMISWLSEK